MHGRRPCHLPGGAGRGYDTGVNSPADKVHDGLPAPPRETVRTLIAAALVVAAVLAVHANSLGGTFVFDDDHNIVHNPLIRRLWPPVRHRPVANLSLAVNYAVGGLAPRGYHMVNLAVHLAAALALLGVVRRTLLSRRLGGRFARSALPTALAVALIWAVHPLQTASVTYVVQRAEALAGLFILLTLYFAIRGPTAKRSWPWLAAAVAACALGMGSKEVAAAAPLVVLVHDRTFVAASWRELLRRRWAFHAALAATWLIAVLPVVSIVAGDGGGTGVAPKTISRPEYLHLQCHAVATYVRLAVWPVGQCLDYGPVHADEVGPVDLAWTVGLLLATAAALWRRPAAGFLGVWFFAILAPSSGLVPLADPVFEHRMYLPLAAVVAAAVLGFRAVIGRLPGAAARAGVGAAIVLAAVGLLGWRTVRRNALFADPVALYRDVIAVRPTNARARANLGFALLDTGDNSLLGEARDSFAQALHYQPTYARAHVGLADVAMRRGDLPRAEKHLREAVALDPRAADAHNNLGAVLLEQKRPAEALPHCREAVRLKPGVPVFRRTLGKARFQLGLARLAQGRPADAVEQLRAALKLRPNHVQAANSLAWVLATSPRGGVRNGPEAIRLARQADAAEGGRNPVILDTLAAAYAEAGRFGEAVATIRRAIALATDAGRSEDAHRYEVRLRLYEAGKPYRDAPPAP